MKLSFGAIALVFVAANAQSTVLAPCGTACPSAPADKTIYRTAPLATESAPCPSLLVSSIAGNGSSPTTGTPSAASFTGAATYPTGHVGAALAAAGAAVAAFAL